MADSHCRSHGSTDCAAHRRTHCAAHRAAHRSTHRAAHRSTHSAAHRGTHCAAHRGTHGRTFCTVHGGTRGKSGHPSGCSAGSHIHTDHPRTGSHRSAQQRSDPPRTAHHRTFAHSRSDSHSCSNGTTHCHAQPEPRGIRIQRCARRQNGRPVCRPLPAGTCRTVCMRRSGAAVLQAPLIPHLSPAAHSGIGSRFPTQKRHTISRFAECTRPSQPGTFFVIIKRRGSGGPRQIQPPRQMVQWAGGSRVH